MKKKYLLFLGNQTTEFRKEVVAYLRARGIVILAQYSNTALEVSIAEVDQAKLRDSGFFTEIFDGPINIEGLSNKSAEAAEIAASWNLSHEASNRGPAIDPNEGLSWGTEGFDEPRPHSELSKDFFLKTLQDRGIRERELPGERGMRYNKDRVRSSFRGIEGRLMDKLNDATKVYHLSRLAIVYPELEETILNLPDDVIIDLLKVNKSDRANLGAESRGPEESCWKMNGEISVGVVFVESSQVGGPTFTATERTTLRNEIQTGLNWLASQHPTGNLSWVYDYQYITINVANGTNSSTEDYWRNPAMQAVNYNGNTYTGDWNGVVNYRADMRTTNDSAHAIVVLVTPYATEWHAYAADARLTLCNRNNWGGWGINVIDTITAHEVCHLFGSADEYTGSGTPCTSCTTTHGCDNVPNGNCKACAPGGGVPCVMDQNSLTICDFTRRQIGWQVLRSPRLPGYAEINAVSRSTDKLDIFATDGNGVIFTAAWEPSFPDWWHGWWELNGGRAAAGAPVHGTSRSQDKLDVFVTGTDNNVYTAAWEPAFTDWWHGWWGLNGGMAAQGAHVTVVSRSQDKLDAFVVGLDGRVYTAAWEPGFTDWWHGWWPIGDIRVPQGAPVHAISRSADKLDIFVTDINGVVFTAAWEPAFTDGWHGWWELNGGRAAPGAHVTVVSRSPDKLDAFVVGTDGGVYTAAWEPGFTDWWHGWWRIGNLVVPQGAAVYGVSRSTDKLDIFATDVNGVICTAAWEPAFTDWWHGWWELNGGRAMPGAPVTAVSRSTDKLDVFVVGTDGRVWTAAWEPGFTDWWHGWWPIGL
jgi:hypothetical protein